MLTLATFNVNSVRSRLPILSSWLKARAPDVVCLQETKVVDEAFPEEVFKLLGYHVAFRGEKAYNGVAIISKHPIQDAFHGFDDGGPCDDSRLIGVQTAGIWIVNTYVPQGRELTHPMYTYKQAWFDRLYTLFSLRFCQDDLLLWTGDLNVAREAIDVHHPEQHRDHVCFHEDVRAAFERCLAWGFVDVYRQFHPEANRYSFFDYRTPNAVKRDIGWRLDYLLASPALAARAVESEIDLEPRSMPKPSDHTPVWARFDEESQG